MAEKIVNIVLITLYGTSQAVLMVANLPADAGHVRGWNSTPQDSIRGLRRSSGEGNGNPLQYSCLENLMDRGAWRATIHRTAKSQTQLK